MPFDLNRCSCWQYKARTLDRQTVSTVFAVQARGPMGNRGFRVSSDAGIL